MCSDLRHNTFPIACLSYLWVKMSERMNESMSIGEFIEENIHLYLKRLDGETEGNIVFMSEVLT